MVVDSFKNALAFVLLQEGGFCDHPADRGGATNKGITQSVYDSYRTKNGQAVRSVQDIEDQEVVDIYRAGYWEAAGCHKMEDPDLQLLVFDWAVNSGPGAPVKRLQKMVGVEQDGKVGPATLAAIAKHREKYGAKMVAQLTVQRVRFYMDLVAKNPSQGVFLEGWLRRSMDLLEAILEN